MSPSPCRCRHRCPRAPGRPELAVSTKSHRLLAGVATGAHVRLGGLKCSKKGKRVVQNLTASLLVSPPVPTSAWAAVKERQKMQRVVQNLTVSLPVSPPVPTSAWAAWRAACALGLALEWVWSVLSWVWLENWTYTARGERDTVRKPLWPDTWIFYPKMVLPFFFTSENFLLGFALKSVLWIRIRNTRVRGPEPGKAKLSPHPTKKLKIYSYYSNIELFVLSGLPEAYMAACGSPSRMPKK